MFDSADTGKIAIRNLPGEVMQALTSLASQRDRSVEAEARRAIRASPENFRRRLPPRRFTHQRPTFRAC